MANLAQIIAYLYPTARSPEDFLVESVRGVASVRHWDEAVLGPQPTLEALMQHEAAADAALADAIARSTVPQSAGPYQIREALLDKGFFTPENHATAYAELDAWVDGLIDQAIPVAAAPAQNAKAKRAWRTASEIRRTDAFTEIVRVAALKTVEETDELFRHAVTI